MVSEEHVRVPPIAEAWTAKTVLLILPVGAAFLLLAWYVLNSSRFDLAGTDAVILRGNHFVSQAEVTAAIGAGAQPNLFRLSLDDARPTSGDHPLGAFGQPAARLSQPAGSGRDREKTVSPS